MESKEIQPELFEEFNQPHKTKRFRFRNLSYYPKGRINISLSYEKSIILLIGFILTFVIVFTLGVEKGKKLSGQIASIRQQDLQFSPLKKQPPVNTEAKVAVAPDASEKPYTIQIASFLKQDLAQKEVNKLKKQGYDAFMIKSDKFYLVCIGEFNSKAQAQGQLTKLKISYKDCFIKRR